MSKKVPLPVLTGQRLRTRKRDEKQKFDPGEFRDAVVTGLNEAEGDWDKSSRFLDLAGNKLDFNRYGETLFDILFAGGILSAGGSISDDGVGKTTFCVFEMETDEKLLKMVETFDKLTRRYKYLIRTMNDNLRKNFKYLNIFSEVHLERLAKFIGHVLSTRDQQMIEPTVLNGLLVEHLVKEEMSLNFITIVFKNWLSKASIESFAQVMKKAGLDGRLIDFFPNGKNNAAAIEEHFNSAGLPKVIEYFKSRQLSREKYQFKQDIKQKFEDEAPQAEIISTGKTFQTAQNLADEDMIGLIFNSMMGTVDWNRNNKSTDLLEKDALNFINANSKILLAFCETPRAQLTLMLRIQGYCYDNGPFMKIFQKITMLLYNNDILEEPAIQKWYRDGHSIKGKSVFLKQMAPMIEWLNNAESESEEE
ncbi:hypothetical protein SARC_01280 [Sphaeroforma arctica JP610]|uniref:W2 domain-containing protein n=1 Tax=Sphaeroforma arctica JP610 TaxID=667725 RepID=A0A0L0GCH4_9EUKA|nr:hypothetical protein SARC_01280 [Sphaeroforma arctica JP610]KNC86599.1 hypothetical protein SARC_01280 [Sphaeroforma arctica JP610]|eukprot:XP_014160501.1 hypothetical protein SARC_01280 [Sphaeroforma arctica JP610]